jgi:hypothetical protein
VTSQGGEVNYFRSDRVLAKHTCQNLLGRRTKMPVYPVPKAHRPLPERWRLPREIVIANAPVGCMLWAFGNQKGKLRFDKAFALNEGQRTTKK